MNYRDTLHAIDTEAALKLIGIEFTTKGPYVSFPCPLCKEKAVVKTYGDKKNLWYCPKCKKGGNLLKLAMETKSLDYEPAKEFLAKTIAVTPKAITEELQLNYELEHNKFPEELGIPEDLCRTLGVGQPKHRNMLAGHIAFTVFNEDGKKVAYYGINLKDRKPKFHSSFNPEMYLYHFNAIDKQQDTLVCTDMFLCLKALADKKQAVSTFGLPYLSQKHLELLNRCMLITVFREDAEIVQQVSTSYNGYVRFYS